MIITLWGLYILIGGGFAMGLTENNEVKGCAGYVVLIMAMVFWPVALSYYVARFLVKEIAK